MKLTRISLFVLLPVIVFAEQCYCQAARPSRSAISRFIQADLRQSPDHRYLYEHSDSYGRLLRLKAFKSLGYDPGKSGRYEIESTVSEDSVMACNISVNEADQNEASISVNRKNPNLIIAGSNDSRMYSNGMSVFQSSDQGKTWRTNFIPEPEDSAFPMPLGDPALAADNAGNFYYCYLAGDGSFENDNIVVAVSQDGVNWTNGSYVVSSHNAGGFEDKEQISIDNNPASPYYGRVYVVWMHFENPSSSRYGGARIAWSDDKCKTWSQIVTISDSGINEFSQVKTGRNGEVLVTFSVPLYSGGNHMFLLSTDGGKSFTWSKLASYADYPTNNFNRDGLKGSFGFRCFPYISQDIDQITNELHVVYATWNHEGTLRPAALLNYITSTDLGKSWSSPKIVGISNPAHSSLAFDRFCPWVSLDQRTGDAYATYYSSENDSNNLLIRAYRTKLTGGLSEYPKEIGDRDFDATLISEETGDPPFIGDYIGSDISDSVYASAWTENRDGHSDGDIYAFIGSLNSVFSHPPVVINSSTIWLSNPLPNPAGNFISVSYFLPFPAELETALYTVLGVKLKILSSGQAEAGTSIKDYELSGIPSGEYYLRLTTPYGRAQKKIVIAK